MCVCVCVCVYVLCFFLSLFPKNNLSKKGERGGKGMLMVMEVMKKLFFSFFFLTVLTIRLARRSSDISGRFATVLQPLNEYRMKNRRGRGYESAHLLIDYCRQRVVNRSEQPVGL